MGLRRYMPPDADRIAARFGVRPASEEAGRRAYLIASALGTANDIRTWNAETWTDGDWQCGSPGLSDRDKLCWRLIAAAAGAS